MPLSRADFATPDKLSITKLGYCRPMRALVLMMLLAACASPGVEEVNPHTGVTTIASRGHTLDLKWNATLSARAAYFERNGTEIWSIYTFVTRGDRNTPKITSAWSHGVELYYRRVDVRRTNCALDCNRQENGEIVLSRELFEMLRNRGLTFHLVGKRGSYTGHLPGDAFSEVLSRVGVG